MKNKINILSNDNIKLKNDLIKVKDNLINDLKAQLENRENKNVNFNDVIVVNFISTYQIINNCGIQCLKSETFAEVEERLYQQYPEFRETNNNFLVRGGLVLRFKKICENNIKTGDRVQLVKIEYIKIFNY